MPIQRQPVESSMIESVGYDAAANVLEVAFKTTGEVYRVEGVTPNVYEGLVGSSSIGKYYNSFIKNQYPTRKVG